jgi:predicted AlkP superfamily pyrophosphatase or phosphodiesterase
MQGGAITSVAPTTTATALSSLTLGMAPAAHGVIGYKFVVTGPNGQEVLNALRWRTPSGDARRSVPPRKVQPSLAFNGLGVPVVSRSDFSGSGFSEVHQHGSREIGWVVPSSLPLLVRGQLLEGEPLVYAYYDGIDKVAHATGMGELYDAELAHADSLVAQVASLLPPGACLAVVADHGQVDVGRKAVPVEADVAAETGLMSGEARFRWLHAKPGRAEELLLAAKSHYSTKAWVATREEVVAAGVFGGNPGEECTARLGDVALVPLGDDAYTDPEDSGDMRLVSRHGGLSPEEVLVPLLATGC